MKVTAVDVKKAGGISDWIGEERSIDIAKWHSIVCQIACGDKTNL